MKNKVFNWLFAVTISLFSFILIILFFSLSPTFYKYEFSQHAVYQEFQETPQVIDEKAMEIISYLNNNLDTLAPPFFSEQARLHMYDVQVLFNWLKIILNISALLSFSGLCFLIYKNKINTLSTVLFRSGFIDIVFVIISLLVTFLSWDYAFTKFHHIMFNNDYWLFDSTDNLIKMLPAEFFQDNVTWIGMVLFFVGLVNLLLGWILYKLYIILNENKETMQEEKIPWQESVKKG